MDSCGSVKVFAVDRKFKTLIDDQAEEDDAARVEREKVKNKKSGEAKKNAKK